MAIIAYGDVSRDTAVLGDNVYSDNGQGCGTVWYPSVEQARKVIAQLGFVPEGRDSGLCEQCSCRYSYGTEDWKKYPEFACREWKEKVARGNYEQGKGVLDCPISDKETHWDQLELERRLGK